MLIMVDCTLRVELYCHPLEWLLQTLLVERIAGSGGKMYALATPAPNLADSMGKSATVTDSQHGVMIMPKKVVVDGKKVNESQARLPDAFCRCLRARTPRGRRGTCARH
jgi:hypothetical protein